MLWTLMALGATALAQDAAYLRINEVLPAPDGTDKGQEWVELYNTAFHQVDLSVCVLERAKGAWEEVATLSGYIDPGSPFLVADPDVGAEADFRLPKGETLDLGNAGSNGDGVRLVCEEVVIDTVLYGSNNDDGLADDLEDPAPAENLAPKPTDDDSLARVFDGDDTDNSAADFCKDDSPSPGEFNTCPGDTGDTGDTGDSGDTGPVTGPVASCADPVRINELISNPDGTDTDLEWVELYNVGTAAVDLAGWGLTYGTSSYTTPKDLVGTIEAGGYFLIGGEMVPDTDQEISLNIGNASTSDAVQLRCLDGIADTVIYGEPNSDEWTDDLGDLATSLASVPGTDQCLARKVNGLDTDLSGDDFWVTDAAECTPGAANAEYTCDVTGVDHVRLNEVVANPSGSDPDAEWVEIYNSGEEAFALDRWVLEAAKSSWSVQATMPGGLEIPAGGHLVIGGELAGTVDVLASLDLGNAGSNGDGVRLVDCEGAIVDTVIYGENNDDGLFDDLGGAAFTLAPEMGDGQSIARYPDGVDTDFQDEDWALCIAPSQGTENADCAAGGGTTDPPDSNRDCGCGSRSDLPESEVDDAAAALQPTCTTVPGGATMGWLMLLGVVGFRRRG